MALAAEDLFEIQNTLHNYMHLLDAGDGQAFAELFTDDGVCELATLGRTIQGREALADFCVATHERFSSAYHWEGNVMIGGAGSVARNDSYWQAVSDGAIISYGKHEDLLSKVGSRWLFKKRIITHAWRKPAA